MLINSKQLWDDGGYGKDNPFERSIQYVYNKADEFKVGREVAESVITEFFIEIANGKSYPTNKCPCGCGIDKSGTAAVHEMVKRLETKHLEIRAEETKLLEERVNALIIARIHRENENYIKEQMRPSWLSRKWNQYMKKDGKYFSD